MGIFDFLFGKKKKPNQPKEQNSNTSSSKPNVGSRQQTQKRKPKPVFLKPKFRANPEWEKELDALIEKDQSHTHPIYVLRSTNNMAAEIRKIMLEGYSIGDGTSAPRRLTDNNISSHATYMNASNNLVTLGQRYGTLDTPNFQTALNGLVKGTVHWIQELQHSPQHTIQSFLSNLLRQGLSYQASLFLELISDLDLSGKLIALTTTYINASEKILKEMGEEIIDTASKENTPSEHPSVTLFQSREELSQYIKFRKHYKHIDRSLDFPNLIKEKVSEEKKTTPDLTHFLRLFLYESSSLYGRSDRDKAVLKLLLENVDIDYHVLQDMMTMFAESNYGGGLFNASVLNREVKKYFKTEPLDPNSYALLQKSMRSADTISRSKAINDFLLSKSENLYNIPNTDFYKLKHSGVLHNQNIENSYYGGKSDATKYLYDVITLLSQVIPTIVEKEHQKSNINTINIGGESFDVSTKDLSKFNEVLFRKGIPYQLVDIYHFDKFTNNHKSPLITTLLVNEDEFAMLSPLFHTKVMSNSAKRWYKNVKFATTPGFAEPLNNNVKQLSKAIKSELSSNKFIHDIKWKEIKNRIVDQFDDRNIWFEIMHILLSYSGTVEPSKTWLSKLEKEKSKLSKEAFSKGIGLLSDDILSNDFWFNKENIKALRGVVWAHTLTDMEDACNSLEELLSHSYIKIPMIGPKSVSCGSSAMAALIHLDSEESYNVLSRLKEETNYDRFEKQLADALSTFENLSKSTVVSLKEGAMDDYGFIDGIKIMEINHPHYLKWLVKDRKVKSQWIDKDGNKLKKAPPISDVQKKGNRATTKMLNEAIDDFDKRIDSYRYAEISWSKEDWKQNYLNHNFVSLIIENYLWIINQEDGSQIVVIIRGGKTLDINNQWYVLGDSDTVRPYHVSEVEKAVNNEWIEYFNEHKLSPPIEYFYRSNFTVEECMTALQKISDNCANIYTHGEWHFHSDRSTETNVKELPFIDKLIMFVRPLKKSESDKPNISISYHESIPKARNKKFNFSKIGPAIDINEIPKKIQLECLNDLMDRLLMRGFNMASFTAENIGDYTQIPQLSIIEQICKKIEETNLYPNYKYKDFNITINGKINTYDLPIIKSYIEIKAREKNNIYRLYNLGKSKKNILKSIGMPYVPNPQIDTLLAAVEHLTDDEKISIGRLKMWIEAK